MLGDITMLDIAAFAVAVAEAASILTGRSLAKHSC